jgi:hypothetical protein
MKGCLIRANSYYEDWNKKNRLLVETTLQLCAENKYNIVDQAIIKSCINLWYNLFVSTCNQTKLNMKNRNSSKIRSDQPSGRQASVQPEHAGGADQSVSSLHQGQGPDFQTQDTTLRENNEAIQQMQNAKNLGYQEAATIHQQRPAEGKQEREQLPSRERNEKSSIGDNPNQIRKETPRVKSK